jgi:hypothetical protein
MIGPVDCYAAYLGPRTCAARSPGGWFTIVGFYRVLRRFSPSEYFWKAGSQDALVNSFCAMGAAPCRALSGTFILPSVFPFDGPLFDGESSF